MSWVAGSTRALIVSLQGVENELLQVTRIVRDRLRQAMSVAGLLHPRSGLPSTSLTVPAIMRSAGGTVSGFYAGVTSVLGAVGGHLSLPHESDATNPVTISEHIHDSFVSPRSVLTLQGNDRGTMRVATEFFIGV